MIQKQSSRGVLMNRCSKKVQQIYRRTPMPKCDFSKVVSNFTEIALQHGCIPVNLPHISRTPFSRNTSGRLLLMIISGNEKRSNSSIRIVFILVWCQTCDLCSERAHNISQFIKIGAVFFVASHGKFTQIGRDITNWIRFVSTETGTANWGNYKKSVIVQWS